MLITLPLVLALALSTNPRSPLPPADVQQAVDTGYHPSAPLIASGAVIFSVAYLPSLAIGVIQLSDLRMTTSALLLTIPVFGPILSAAAGGDPGGLAMFFGVIASIVQFVGAATMAAGFVDQGPLKWRVGNSSSPITLELQPTARGALAGASLSVTGF